LERLSPEANAWKVITNPFFFTTCVEKTDCLWPIFVGHSWAILASEFCHP
jgi:hypothetical protein